MLNRAAMILRPAQPYLDWAQSLGGSDVLPDPEDEQTVYLVPQFEDVEDPDFLAYIELIYDNLFEMELHGWHTIQADWPQHRTLDMFRQWFRIELHSIVEDLVDEPLDDDDD